MLAGAVGEYYDFICNSPDFVRLMEWEALGGARHLREVPPHLEVAREALGAIVSELALPPAEQGEARQLLLSMIGLCWFPVVHGPTMLRALGADLSDPGFREERRRHVISLVVQGIAGRLSPAALEPSGQQ